MKDKKVYIINGEEYESVEVTPGIGFKSKEEEEQFIEDYVRSLEEQDYFQIYNVEVSGRYKS